MDREGLGLVVIALLVSLCVSLDCDLRDSCWNSTFVSSEESTLVVNCSGPRSCRGAIIECQTNHSCIVLCDGEYSCLELTEGQLEGSHLKLECNGKGSCGMVDHCDPVLRDCNHVCEGKCSCWTDSCNELSDQKCEMKDPDNLQFNLKCGVLSQLANELPYPPENVDILTYPSTFQLLFDYNVLPENTTLVEQQLKPILDKYIYTSLLVGVNITTRFVRPMDRLVLVMQDDVASSEAGISGALLKTIQRNSDFDNKETHINTIISNSSIQVSLVIYGDATPFRANSYLYQLLIKAFVTANFPVMYMDVYFEWSFSFNKTEGTLIFPSGCAPPRPFFKPYCSTSGSWFSQEAVVDSPDVFITDVVVQTLLIDEDVNILSSLTANSLDFTYNSNLTINQITSMQISSCPTFAGSLNIANRTVDDFIVGIPLVQTNATCQEADIGAFHLIRTSSGIPQECLKYAIRKGTIMILMDPSCTPSDSSSSVRLGVFISLGLILGILLLVLGLFMCSETFRSKVVPSIDVAKKMQRFLSSKQTAETA
eukprot:TRINITY_DN24938_c0_g1_i1.p1 TRINITY_DN24938_c0_g1~~TRINITY_DN24938_c0_g1_i1.p1  ORF type:complete len:539 (+),score=66.52 TRINITY_DN24938_c0_g1_i1:40-1656(+)